MGQLLQAKKRKLEEVDLHSVQDYKAMIGRGVRTDMRQAYAAQYNVQPEREYEGSDHMLGVLKRVLCRGQFLAGSQLDLNKIVAHHPQRRGTQVPTPPDQGRYGLDTRGGVNNKASQSQAYIYI